MGAGGWVDTSDGDLAALRAMPRGDAMAPPELARDAPVVDVLHPLEVSLLVHLRRKADVLLADSLFGLVGQRLNLDEPLCREARLDDRLAAVAVADIVDVVLDAGEELPLFQVLDYLFTGSVAVEAGVCAAFGVDVARVVHDVDGGQVVALGEGEVVGVVGRSDLDRAGSEVAADPRVEDDGNLAAHQRQAQLLAVQGQIALVFGMDGNGYVAEHGLGAGCCYRQKLAGILTVFVKNRVANLP